MFEVIVFILVLSVLVLVHEFGHFLVARKNGIWVEEFGIGYPPRIWGKKFGETLYSVNLLPLGGFVRLHGEQSEDEVSKPKRAFVNKSKKVRVGVLAAGVLMNFLLAVGCFAIFYSFSGVPKQTDKVIISGVVKDGPADKAGIKSEDVVLTVDGTKVYGMDNFSKLIAERKGKEVSIEVLAKGESNPRLIKITPRVDVPENEGPLGVLITQTEIYFAPIWQRPFLGIYYGFKDALFWGKTILLGLYTMVVNIFKGQVPKDIAGPVGIFAITTEVAKVGILPLINFIGIFSVNLAVVNFLPFPALDGGRFLFIVIEKVFGRKVLPKVEATIHAAGMVVLLSLFALVTFVEVKRLIIAGSLEGFLESTLK
jgi:regulator of sigma E protease